MSLFSSNKNSNFNLTRLAGPFFNSLRRKLVVRFARFAWLAAYIKSLQFGSNVRVVAIEPSLEEEQFKLVVYEGTLVGRVMGINSMCVVLRQSLSACYVERTFFLNSTNLIYVEANF